ncbi:MAG: aminoacyl-tRNA hydrolase [Bdellovibrio sp.]|nr:aminoacyl-tRNA hydrolase [Methylotenera sp.]
MPIKLFVGLGNPGDKYAATRHNAGFWFIDAIARQINSKLALDAKMLGVVGKFNQDNWLLKPTTFMNNSGKAVAALANYYKILPSEILVAHDELDLPTGSAKLKFGGGHGGHNGLRDIHAALGTADYWRLRLGIGHPGDKNEVVNYVLKPPTIAEDDALQASIDGACRVLPQLIAGEFENAMLKLHTK